MHSEPLTSSNSRKSNRRGGVAVREVGEAAARKDVRVARLPRERGAAGVDGEVVLAELEVAGRDVHEQRNLEFDLFQVRSKRGGCQN